LKLLKERTDVPYRIQQSPAKLPEMSGYGKFRVIDEHGFIRAGEGYTLTFDEADAIQRGLEEDARAGRRGILRTEGLALFAIPGVILLIVWLFT
jgi:hypothetical protein